MPIIEVKDLSKTYEFYKKEPGLKASLKQLFHREKQFAEAVNKVSFSIEPGELVGFVGPNGAGKTTTLKMLSGILYPSGGEASVLGYTPWRRQREYQKQFALVMGQKNQLWWDLPALESLELAAAIYEMDEAAYRESLAELTGALGLSEYLSVPVRKLSLGQRMKCELAAALLHRPKVLFLDEPTIGLDVVAQKNIRDFLKRYNRERGTTIILTSHYMEDIKELCERIIIIDVGAIVYDGRLDAVIRQYAPVKELKVVFNGDGVARKALVRFGEVSEYDRHAATIVVPRDQVRAVAGSLLNSDLAVDDINIEEPDIQTVIRRIFSDQDRGKSPVRPDRGRA